MDNHKNTAKQNPTTALLYNKRISLNNLFFLIPSATRNLSSEHRSAKREEGYKVCDGNKAT
jgi:hypothetical protein